MGGAAHVGNATASAEFNVFHDPEAAAVVLDAASDLGIPVTMYGLDVFYDPRVTRDAKPTAWSQVGGRGAAELGGRLIAFQCERFASTAATIGDAGAVCAVIDPDGVRTERLPVRVELAGTWSRGRTIVDRRDWSGDLAHDPHGAAPAAGRRLPLGVDAERYRPALARHPRGRGGVMGRVVVLGSLNVDLVTDVERHPRPGETVLATGPVRRFAGGKGGNQAVAAAEAGAGVAMVGARRRGRRTARATSPACARAASTSPRCGSCRGPPPARPGSPSTPTARTPSSSSPAPTRS